MSLRLKAATTLVWGASFILLWRGTSFAQITLPRHFSSNGSFASNKIIVKLKSQPSALAIMSAGSQITGAQYLGTLPGANAVVYSVANVGTAVVQAQSNPNVAYAGRVPRVFITKVTNDTLLNKQWALPNMKVSGNGQTAWDLLGDVAGKTGVIKVAVVDTGADRSHPDLAGKIADSDYMGCDSSGCNTTLNALDGNGHGTHVSGIIGAVTNNSLGIAGVGWNVKMMSLKVLGDDGSGDFDIALKGVKAAADNGVKVINMSFGAPENGMSDQDKQFIQNAMDYAWSKGAVLVAAAGNCGGADYSSDTGCAYTTGTPAPIPTIYFVQNPVMYPAAANHVISVAALNRNNQLASYSEHGSWVDVAAPGGECTSTSDRENCILSTWSKLAVTPNPPTPTQPYYFAYGAGTSMAAPQVSGVAALVWAANPSWTNQQVEDFIEKYANKNIAAGSTANGAVDACTSVYAALNNGATPPASACVLSATTGTPAPTSGEEGLITPTSFPAPPTCPVVPGGCRRGKGDANCDGKIDMSDYNVWSGQFGKYGSSSGNSDAHFICNPRNPNTLLVNMEDFEIWRRHTSSLGGLTGTPAAPTSTPPPGTPPVSSTPTAGPTATPASCRGTNAYCTDNSQCCSGVCKIGGSTNVCE